MKNYILLKLLIIFVWLLILKTSIYAECVQDNGGWTCWGFKIAPYTTEQITAFTQCHKVVWKNTSNWLFVPIKSSSEWSSFLAHYPTPDVELKSCVGENEPWLPYTTETPDSASKYACSFYSIDNPWNDSVNKIDRIGSRIVFAAEYVPNWGWKKVAFWALNTLNLNQIQWINDSNQINSNVIESVNVMLTDWNAIITSIKTNQCNSYGWLGRNATLTACTAINPGPSSTTYSSVRLRIDGNDLNTLIQYIASSVLLSWNQDVDIIPPNLYVISTRWISTDIDIYDKNSLNLSSSNWSVFWTIQSNIIEEWWWYYYWFWKSPIWDPNYYAVRVKSDNTNDFIQSAPLPWAYSIYSSTPSFDWNSFIVAWSKDWHPFIAKFRSNDLALLASKTLNQDWVYAQISQWGSNWYVAVWSYSWRGVVHEFDDNLNQKMTWINAIIPVASEIKAITYDNGDIFVWWRFAWTLWNKTSQDEDGFVIKLNKNCTWIQ